MNTTDKYFFWGSAVPNFGSWVQYGLYAPALDRFVIVHSDKSILNLLSKLFSSRYHLILCRLDQAKNFNKNLIDNSVCLNWTIAEKYNLDISKFPDFESDDILISELAPNDIVVASNDLLVKDQLYLLAAASWLSSKLLYDRFCNFIDVTLLDLVTDSQVANFKNHPYKDFVKELHSIIYNVYDFEQAKIAVNDLFYRYSYE